jgi:3-(3-hydroxy-phenyl)propionate hydroxylase
MTSEAFDVAISGYGLTGQALACLLARRGHRVCVVERWPTLYGQPRTATIDGESARILQAACDIDEALRNSLPRERYLFANGAGDVLIDHAWSGTDVSGFPRRLSVHQPDIEEAMDAFARSRRVVVLQGWEVVGVTQDAQSASITARERQVKDDGTADLGDTRLIRARYVVGADGARSAVRTVLGIDRESWPSRGAWLSFDAVRKGTLPDFWGLSPDGQVAVIFCVPNGRAHSIIPLGTDNVRFNFQVDPDTDHADKLNDEAAYHALATVYGVTPDDVEVYRHAVYPFEGKLAKTWRAGRVILAGDAAHLMTPFLGQGGCSALRDAINLAWKLDLVLRGVAPDALLNSYEAERLPHTRTYIEGSDRLAALAFVASPREAAARDKQFTSGEAPVSAKEPTMTTGILHREADGTLARPVGEPGPQGEVLGGGEVDRFDDLVDWGFQLIGWECDPAQHLRPEQRKFLETIGTTIVQMSDQPTIRNGVVDLDGVYEQFFRAHNAVVILVRPDFIVFGVARSPAELPSLVDDLRAQLRGGR